MRVLHFSVNEQNIKKSGDFSGIVKGSKGYLKAEGSRFLFYRGKRICSPDHPEPVHSSGRCDRRRLFPCAGCRSGKRTDHQNK